MNESIHLKASKMPRILGDLMHSNQFLKLFSLFALLITAFSLIVVFAAVTKTPTVLPLAIDGSLIDKTALLKAEDQIEKAVRRYLDLRYRWEPKTVQQKIKEAKSFILPSAMKAFDVATGSIVKFSTEKQVSQRVYPERIMINVEDQTVSILGDRLPDFQGLRAAGILKLTLFFESGPRTVENPWGIYFTKEREE